MGVRKAGGRPVLQRRIQDQDQSSSQSESWLGEAATQDKLSVNIEQYTTWLGFKPLPSSDTGQLNEDK